MTEQPRGAGAADGVALITAERRTYRDLVAEASRWPRRYSC